MQLLRSFRVLFIGLAVALCVPLLLPAQGALTGQVAAFPSVLGWITSPIVALVFAAAKPAIVAALTVPLVNLAKGYFTLIGKLPSWAQRVIVAVVSAVGAMALPLIGAPSFPTDVSGVTVTWASGVIAGALAFLFHLADRQKASSSSSSSTATAGKG